MTKVPHLIMFGVFFLITIVQFDSISRRSIVGSVLATAALGLLVEIEEGLTRTGYCRLTDVLPDIVGALVAAVVVITVARLATFLRKRVAA